MQLIQNVRKINAYKPVSFKESAITKALDKAGSLIADIKTDGVRGHIVVTPEGWAQVSRTNKPLPALVSLFDGHEDALSAFLLESRYPAGIVIDGEWTVKGKSFQEGSGMLRRKEQLPMSDLIFTVYGVIPYEVFKTDEPFGQTNCVMQMVNEVTVNQLAQFLPKLSWQKVQTYDVYSMEELTDLYESVREAGHEGLVVKDPLGEWKRGKKTGWWKMKPEDTVDGQVVGLNWGTEGLANEGKVIGFQVLLENGQVVDANGITKAQMEEFTAAALRARCLDNAYNENDLNPYHGWYAQVKFMERTEGGSLRHPSFDCWRGTETDPTEKS